MITLKQAVDLVLFAFSDSLGGEIYVSKIPSMNVTDIAKTINNRNKIKIIGIRPGEKLHEIMVSKEDSYFTYEYKKFYKILSSLINSKKMKSYIKNGKKVPNGFEYSSNNNKSWMKRVQLKNWIDTYVNSNDFDKI